MKSRKDLKAYLHLRVRLYLYSSLLIVFKIVDHQHQESLSIRCFSFLLTLRPLCDPSILEQLQAWHDRTEILYCPYTSSPRKSSPQNFYVTLSSPLFIRDITSWTILNPQLIGESGPDYLVRWWISYCYCWSQSLIDGLGLHWSPDIFHGRICREGKRKKPHSWAELLTVCVCEREKEDQFSWIQLRSKGRIRLRQEDCLDTLAVHGFEKDMETMITMSRTVGHRYYWRLRTNSYPRTAAPIADRPWYDCLVNAAGFSGTCVGSN